MYVYFIILEEHATYFHKWLFLHVHTRVVCTSKSKTKYWKSEVFQITMKKTMFLKSWYNQSMIYSIRKHVYIYKNTSFMCTPNKKYKSQHINRQNQHPEYVVSPKLHE